MWDYDKLILRCEYVECMNYVRKDYIEVDLV